MSAKSVWCDEEFISHDRNRTEKKVDVFVKGKIFVKGDVKKFNMIRQMDS